MRKLKPLISIILTTYNRCDLLKNALEKVYSQTYTNLQVIVSDDCSTDNTESIKNLYPKVDYIMTPNNMGYTKNSLFALDYAKGEYILFLADDDELYNVNFLSKAVEKFNSDEKNDIVFSKVIIDDGQNSFVNSFDFKDKYSSIEFLNEWKNLRFNHEDYYVLSTILFKKSILEVSKPFKTYANEPFSIDVSTIINAISISRQIAFINLIGLKWRRPFGDSLGAQNKDNLIWQINGFLSAPVDIYNFYKENQNIVNIEEDALLNILNERILYSFDAITSDYLHRNFEENAKRVFSNFSNEPVYIYGRGWTGLELEQMLFENKRCFKGFIDDYKYHYADTISFEEFFKKDENCVVVISSYKYKDIYKIYKRLNTLKNIKILDLVSE